MNLRLTLTANAGVILSFGEKGPVYAIDALHDTKTPEFSCLSAEQVTDTFALMDKAEPDALLATHCHPDHYSAGLFEKAAERYKNCRLIKPWSEPEKENRIYNVNGGRITAIPLVHRFAERFPGVENYGFIIEVGWKTVFATGDGEPLSEEMMQLAESLHPDAAIMPFLWTTFSKHRRVLDTFAPKNTVFLHLPFAGEDSHGYNHAALTAAGRYYPKAAVLNTFMQTVCFEL